MESQTLLQYISVALPRIPLGDPGPSSQNTTSASYDATDIINVVHWHEFSYANIIQRYGGILNSKTINSDPITSPPRVVTDEPSFSSCVSELVQPRIIRALQAGFEELAPQLQQLHLVPITFEEGGCDTELVGEPDAAFITPWDNHGTSQIRLPGKMELSFKWHSNDRFSRNSIITTEYNQVLAQVNFNMIQHDARYGFVLTDKELVAIKRLAIDTAGHLAVSASIPWAPRGCGRLGVLMGLWYLGMLAAEEYNWSLVVPRSPSKTPENTASRPPTTRPTSAPFTDTDFYRSTIVREIRNYAISSIFEAELDGESYSLELFHNNGDPGYNGHGRDLNPFRCESNAYKKLVASGVCDRGFVPRFYGCIEHVDLAAFYPAFQNFACDKFRPNAIIKEYFPGPESLNCVNYSDTLFAWAILGIEEIHQAGVYRHDVNTRNLHLIRGSPDRLVWLNFEVSEFFTDLSPEWISACDDETARVRGYGRQLVRKPFFENMEKSVD
jgi:hypothetical protein